MNLNRNCYPEIQKIDTSRRSNCFLYDLEGELVGWWHGGFVYDPSLNPIMSFRDGLFFDWKGNNHLGKVVDKKVLSNHGNVLFTIAYK